MKIKKFNQLNEEIGMNFFDAFNAYIKGQTVKESISINPYGDMNIPLEERYYGQGMSMNNGYKILYHGGGCSGEDCNTTFIVDPDNSLVARNDW